MCIPLWYAKPAKSLKNFVKYASNIYLRSSKKGRCKRFQQLLKWRKKKMQFDEPTKKNAKKLLYFRHCQSVYRLFKDLRFDPGFLLF